MTGGTSRFLHKNGRGGLPLIPLMMRTSLIVFFLFMFQLPTAAQRADVEALCDVRCARGELRQLKKPEPVK
jgi:hypothetical protein